MIFDFLALVETEEQRDAINELFLMHCEKMKSIAMSVLHNHADAEDAMMNAFLYMCENASMFEDYKNPRVYGLIFLKTRCAAIDIYRKNKRHAALLATLKEDVLLTSYNADEDDLSDIIFNQENRKLFHEVLNSLEDIYRIPVSLKYFYEMRSNEIAAFMGIAESVVNVRIYRARKMLKEICKERGYEYDGKEIQ